MSFVIENSELNPLSVITITDQCFITGNKGTVFSFLRLRQYIMCGEDGNVYVPCNSCSGNTEQLQDFYRVCIYEEEFLVPKSKACVEGYIRTEYEQDLTRNWYRKYVDQVSDYIKAVEEQTGRIINTGKTDYANQDRYNRIKGQKGRNNGKHYGETKGLKETV